MNYATEGQAEHISHEELCLFWMPCLVALWKSKQCYFLHSAFLLGLLIHHGDVVEMLSQTLVDFRQTTW
jgi:hypothetical protein